MIYTELTKMAMRIAYDAHYGQVDRGNTPYICHPLHVAAQMGEDETAVTAAILHDVLEDSSVSREDLEKEGIPEEIIRMVEILTRKRQETYAEYISRIIASGNVTALRVKYQDITHNLDTTRTADGTLPEYLLKRYHAALKRIEEALREQDPGNGHATGELP